MKLLSKLIAYAIPGIILLCGVATAFSPDAQRHWLESPMVHAGMPRLPAQH